MHADILSEFEAKDDLDEAKKYFEISGQNVLWSNLCNIITSGISEKFIMDLLECPKDSNTIVQVGKELEKMNKLNIISYVLLSENNCFEKEADIISIKLKLLAELDDDRYLQLINELENVQTI